MNNIIFFGPPGAGKGTQAKIISKILDIPHLSTGEILRKKTNQKDALALELNEIMNKGQLVSDNILNKIISERLVECKTGFILDGYPRTLDQLNFLNNFLGQNSLKINFIFNIMIDFIKIEERIIKRSSEEKRGDDNIETIKTRYTAYIDSTHLVSENYRKNSKEIFFEIDGNNEIAEITSKIKKILKI